jgi:hypothetical protein
MHDLIPFAPALMASYNAVINVSPEEHQRKMDIGLNERPKPPKFLDTKGVVRIDIHTSYGPYFEKLDPTIKKAVKPYIADFNLYSMLERGSLDNELNDW